jgi:D,D-heptose 1,7-bisphosphate phosphatase
MDLVILAGGRGIRINTVTKKLPKPIIKFKRINFLQHLINHYAKYDFDNIYILAGYKGSKIYKKFNDKIQNFVKIRCFIEKKKMDTGGALNIVKKYINKDFVLINGDTYVDFNLKNLTKKLNAAIGRILLIKAKSNKLNNLDINKNIVNFCKKKNLSNCGVYFFKKEIFTYIPKNKCSLENEVLPQLIQKRLIKGIKIKNFFIDIGTPKMLIKAKKILPKYFCKPAAFLDRDGVINDDFGHVYKIKEFKLKKGIKLKLKTFIKKNYHVFIITNQAGVAKNLYKEKDFNKLHLFVKRQFLKENIYISDVKACFHHPQAELIKYKKKCNCRKPDIGMLKEIEKNWLIDKKNSFFIGDRDSDKLCAEKYGVKFYFNENFNINSLKETL